MWELRFQIHVCGMSMEAFAPQIMLYRPVRTVAKTFSQEALDRLGIAHVSELIGFIKQDPSMSEVLGEWGLENIGVETLYIQRRDCLLGLLEDKALSDIFDYFHSEYLELVYFVAGGASFHNETSYRFTIHPNEGNHRYMPHVHVSKEEVEVRYSLETLQPIDPLVNPHRRDHKKIILPFLRKNQKDLLRLWQLYMDGYSSPIITQEGKQFYRES